MPAAQAQQWSRQHLVHLDCWYFRVQSSFLTQPEVQPDWKSIAEADMTLKDHPALQSLLCEVDKKEGVMLEEFKKSFFHFQIHSATPNKHNDFTYQPLCLAEWDVFSFALTFFPIFLLRLLKRDSGLFTPCIYGKMCSCLLGEYNRERHVQQNGHSTMISRGPSGILKRLKSCYFCESAPVLVFGGNENRFLVLCD